MLSRLETWINKISDACGVIASILFVLLLFNIFYDVVARYLFSQVSIGMQEMEWHLFAAMFLLAIPYTIRTDGNVRVDLIYEGRSDRGKALINLFGTLVLLLPFVLLIAWFGIDFAYQAFDLGEGSGDPGGLPHRWIIKAVIPLSFFMMALAGVAVVIRSLKVLKQGDNS
ncbi:TRAP transporter small permease subunit [Leucothrix arctica]|uniref:TRAP transporter small permease protein n=1 Tax=Leucothrix arctica TaxID=1481894 RepID=A0A317CF54_9GAMM|nr:TRAP transporter small permease subunit [Leucothrix arctica]PWQ97274.1 C4-dicarboxylate ABC transporter [Leucothrix arctica]